MNEKQATIMAECCGGEPWQSGGGIWLVMIHRHDGRLVVISGDAICEYQDEDAFDRGDARTTILFH